MYEATSFIQLMSNLAYDLINNPDYVCKPRDQKIFELINCNIKIKSPVLEVWQNIESRKFPVNYLRKELYAYYAGINDAEYFEKISSMWGKIKTKHNTINSAYGYIIFKQKINNAPFTQYEWVRNSLIADKDSRQAVMFVSDPQYQYLNNKDFVCTLNYHFLIRDNKLNMIVTRRSQDIHYGLSFDLPWEVSLMHVLCDDLRTTYPDLEVGDYHLNCGSLHLYERNLKTYQNLLTEIERQIIEEKRMILPVLNKDIFRDIEAGIITDRNII
jgi:thymidylate synthase